MSRYVVADGPWPTQDRHGDEVPEWSVTITDDDGNEYKSYTCYSYAAAMKLAENIADDRDIEFVNDASPA